MTKVILKLSGSALGGGDSVFFREKFQWISKEIKTLTDAGHCVAVVPGGGNLWRHRDNKTWDIARNTSDRIGMIASALNAVLLTQALEKEGIEASVMGAFPMHSLVENYDIDVDAETYNDGKVLVFGGGTGMPYHTTDMAAAQRACELQADLVIKCTNTDGVYSADPKVDSTAVKYKQLTYNETIEKRLNVMDMPALAMLRENDILTRVTQFGAQGNLLKAANGEDIGTLITV